MRTLITSALLASAAFGFSFASIEPASAQTAPMALDCLVNECAVANVPAGTASFWWSLNGPGGPVNDCSATDATCTFGCTRIVGMRVSVTAFDANGQALATASRTAGCAPTDW